MTVPVGSTAKPSAHDASIDLKVRAELLRTAFEDSLYGGSFAALVALGFGYIMRGAAPADTVWTWVTVTVACNLARLVTRWLFLRRPVPPERIPAWSLVFTLVSGATGLSWGIGGWIFFTLGEPAYRLLTVLVLSALTTGAARLLVPVIAANLAYFYLTLVPLMAAFMADRDLRSPTVAILCLYYLGFMTVAAGHAALLLAQGAGRLLRRAEDRGVVAILDSRMATARYGGYLRASLPPFWTTTDPGVVRQALARLR